MTKKKTTTTDDPTQPLYLVISEERRDGYYHLRGRIATQKYDNHQWIPYGRDDEWAWSTGILTSGLHISCQGDRQSQTRTDRPEPVYGFSCEYRDVYQIDARKATRMAKTLTRVNAKLEKLSEQRGYVKTFGEYCGRVAEALGCAGIAVEKSRKSQSITGQRWDWMTLGEGVNRVNQCIWLWQQEEAVDKAAEGEALPAASLRLSGLIEEAAPAAGEEDR
jgi:hypothetical protein